MSVIRNKQRLLHLYRYLMENTDEDHQITTNDLVQFLKQEDANASRKTVKDDIEVLVKEGIDIITTKSYYNSYFIGERTFEIPEITFLVDSIESNASLTITPLTGSRKRSARGKRSNSSTWNITSPKRRSFAMTATPFVLRRW